MTLKNQIINLCNNHGKKSRCLEKYISTELYNEIIKATKNCRDNFKERIYWILNDISDYPKCEECKNIFKPRYYGINSGYRAKFCSHICGNRSEKTLKKKKETVIKKCGYEYYLQDPSFLKKRQDEYFEKTGFKYVWSNPEVNKKRKKTLIERYGVVSPMQLEEIKNKKNKTMINRYGVEHSMQDKDIFEKNHKCSSKKLFLPDNSEHFYQGYENIAILELLDMYELNVDLIIKRKDIPAIWYFNSSKRHRYFPDIFIKSKNLIIEVKSEYTFKKYLEINLIKAKACLDLGYSYEFWICNKHSIVNKINYNKGDLYE
jgi:hypothetical protein